MGETDVCSVCNRLHGKEQSCPQRVANAYMMQPQALEQLTEDDKKWMASNPISVLDVLEEELADRMGVVPVYRLAEQ